MSLADFCQDAQDHARLFVYVTALGETSGSLYGAVVEALHDFPPIRRGPTSYVFLRFLNQLPRWARGGQPWQDFQPYKQVLGVLAIAQCRDVEDLDMIEPAFRQVCARFSGTLRDSRCVVYGSKACLGKMMESLSHFSLVEFDYQRAFSAQPAVKKPELERIVRELANSIYGALQTRIGDLTKELESGRVLRPLRSPLDGKEFEPEEETK